MTICEWSLPYFLNFRPFSRAAAGCAPIRGVTCSNSACSLAAPGLASHFMSSSILPKAFLAVREDHFMSFCILLKISGVVRKDLQAYFYLFLPIPEYCRRWCEPQ